MLTSTFMEQPNRFWYLRNPYAWIVLILGVVTAVVIGEWWVVLVGVIGYEFALLIDLTRGQSLGRSGRVRLARLEQEYRELKAEQARLIGAIDERDRKLAAASAGGPGSTAASPSAETAAEPETPGMGDPDAQTAAEPGVSGVKNPDAPAEAPGDIPDPGGYQV
ncbi:MAG: hypothetical protein R3335_07205 [Anaerolineales bacterium]|nr:hypothetical protein [Anaerolineales bacterium]